MTAETDAALLMLRSAMDRTDDPLEVFGHVSKVGAAALDRLGINIIGPAEIKAEIGTDDEPDTAKITIIWKLREES